MFYEKQINWEHVHDSKLKDVDKSRACKRFSNSSQSWKRLSWVINKFTCQCHGTLTSTFFGFGTNVFLDKKSMQRCTTAAFLGLIQRRTHDCVINVQSYSNTLLISLLINFSFLVCIQIVFSCKSPVLFDVVHKTDNHENWQSLSLIFFNHHDKHRKALRATAFLFPLLGMNQLLFCVNPRDEDQFEDAYLLINSILQSSQGMLVAILYCFKNTQTQAVIKAAYCRHVMVRNVNNSTQRLSESRARKSIVRRPGETVL